MKKTIVLAIAIWLCTASIGNSFAKSNHSVPATAPQDTSVVQRLPPMSPSSDSTDTATKAPPASPQNPDTPPSSPDNNNQVDSANAD